jgi:hypothetical protein
MPVSVDDGILMALREAGSSDAQIADAKLVLGSLCRMDGTNCLLVTTGAPLESEKSMEWLRANKPHLLPTDRADADACFLGAGNITLTAKLIREIGREAADALAKQYGKAHALDTRPGVSPQSAQQKNANGKTHATNPFSKAGWSIQKQGALVRSLGIEKAAAMAKAVGVTIGATKPVM